MKNNIRVIKPPELTFRNIFDQTYKVFLAGSIEMGKAVDWQLNVENYINSNSDQDLILYNPRRDDWDSSWEQEYTNPHFAQQVSWELKALKDSDFIIMYFDPSTKSPITLLELGLYANSGKIAVSCPKGYWKRGNVQMVCSEYNIPFFETLDELCEYSMLVIP